MYECISCIVQFSEKETSYIDLTGKFPHKSSRGNQYLLLLYDFDSNAILVEPLKCSLASAIVKAWSTLNSKLTYRGHITKHYIVDNECNAELKKALTKNELTFELTRRRNNHTTISIVHFG